jgi:hypothetical protein
MQVDQVGRQHVHVEQGRHRLCFVAFVLGLPERSVMHDGPQLTGVGPEAVDKGQDPGLAAEIGVQGDGTQFAQVLQRFSFGAVADDHRLALGKQPFRAVQADTLAGAGDQDRGEGGHARLVMT